MKFLTRIILVFFIFFQFSSSIIYLIETDKKTKITMVLDEEENSKEESKEIKEFKTEFLAQRIAISLFSFDFNSNEDNHHYYLLKDYTSKSNLFLPPPEQV